jgi:hypothetical protein
MSGRDPPERRQARCSDEGYGRLPVDRGGPTAAGTGCIVPAMLHSARPQRVADAIGLGRCLEREIENARGAQSLAQQAKAGGSERGTAPRGPAQAQRLATRIDDEVMAMPNAPVCAHRAAMEWVISSRTLPMKSWPIISPRRGGLQAIVALGCSPWRAPFLRAPFAPHASLPQAAGGSAPNRVLQIGIWPARRPRPIGPWPAGALAIGHVLPTGRAMMSISIRYSGRASPCTMMPIETGCTPFSQYPTTW